MLRTDSPRLRSRSKPRRSLPATRFRCVKLRSKRRFPETLSYLHRSALPTCLTSPSRVIRAEPLPHLPFASQHPERDHPHGQRHCHRELSRGLHRAHHNPRHHGRQLCHPGEFAMEAQSQRQGLLSQPCVERAVTAVSPPRVAALLPLCCTQTRRRCSDCKHHWTHTHAGLF